MNAGLIRGREAQIRWAYYVAAGVEGWALMRQTTPPPRKGVPMKWRLTARLVGEDKFKMAQRPLLFVTLVKDRRWLFQIEDFRIEGDRLTATLGPREDY